MKCKSLCFFSLLSITYPLSASAALLDSYEAIKNHLLKGGKMSVIINSETDCKLLSQHGPIPYAANTYSLDVKTFNIKIKNNNIEINSATDLNPPDAGRNLPPNFHSLTMNITPEGKIFTEETGISLVDYSTAVSFVTSCVIGSETNAGVKFIPY